jgi:hypothetical protein
VREDDGQHPHPAEGAQRSARTFHRGNRYLYPGWVADEGGGGGGDPLGAVAHARDGMEYSWGISVAQVGRAGLSCTKSILELPQGLLRGKCKGGSETNVRYRQGRRADMLMLCTRGKTECEKR